MICQKCGVEAPTKKVTFYQNIGALVMRFSETSEGYFCKSCVHRTFWKYTLVNLLVGWWGFISFFVNIFFNINNFFVYLFALGMPPVPAGARVPELEQNAINRLGPFSEKILDLLEQGQELEDVAVQIGQSAGVSPGQVILFLRRGFDQGNFDFANGGGAATTIETTATSGSGASQPSRLLDHSEQSGSASVPDTQFRSAEFQSTSSVSGHGATSIRPPARPGKVALVLGMLTLLGAGVAIGTGTWKLSKYEPPVWPEEDLHSLLQNGVTKISGNHKFSLSRHTAFYDMLVYEYEYSRSQIVKPDNAKVTLTIFPIVPHNRGIIGSTRYKNVMIDGQYTAVPTNLSHKKIALVETSRFSRENDLPQRNDNIADAFYTYRGRASTVLSYDNREYLEKHMPGVDLSKLMVFKEGASDKGRVPWALLIGLGIFLGLISLVLLAAYVINLTGYRGKIRSLQNSGQLPRGPIE